MTSLATAVLLPGFIGTELPDWLAERLRSGLAGVCLFASNIASADQLRRLTDAIRAANPEAIIAVDEEGGDVTRLHHRTGSPYPGNAVLGRIGDLERTASVGRAVGAELADAGITLDFAPDADVNSNPDNPVIGVRSFGTDPEDVGRHVAAWTTGLQSTGVAACAKHFPGHGDTAQDSHLALPVVDRSLDELRERELVPFRHAIAAGARTVMTSHIMLPQVDPDNPATFSSIVLQQVLRAELGFDGLIVTDALDMAGASASTGIPEAAVRAVAAGCDLLCIGTGNTDQQLDEIGAALADALESGRIPAARWADATDRVRALGREGAAAVSQRGSHRGFDDDFPANSADLDIRAVIDAFDIADGTTPPRDPILVSISTEANMAIGSAPWGPAAAGLSVVVVRETDAVPDAGVRPLVIVGRGNHRYEWVRAFIDDARTRHPHTVVVDMGWPSDDRAYADVATFGASRGVAEALANWLGMRGTS